MPLQSQNLLSTYATKRAQKEQEKAAKESKKLLELKAEAENERDLKDRLRYTEVAQEAEGTDEEEVSPNRPKITDLSSQAEDVEVNDPDPQYFTNIESEISFDKANHGDTNSNKESSYNS